MNDLSKRLREMAERDARTDLLGGIPHSLREAADALDARDAQIRLLKRIIYLHCDPMDMPPTDSLVVNAICAGMNSALPDEETPEDV